jgi:uncharacterized protein YecT (DUF1311 family)
MFYKLSRALLLCGFVMPVSLLAISASSQAIAPKIDCAKANSTVEMKYCSQLSYQAADKQLNLVYRKVLGTTQGEPRQLLITGQQAWIKFRDNSCDFEVYQSRGGTGYEIFRNGCLEKLTKQRTQNLQDYLTSK